MTHMAPHDSDGVREIRDGRGEATGLTVQRVAGGWRLCGKEWDVDEVHATAADAVIRAGKLVHGVDR